jgi:hypothetical protein
MPDRSLFQGVRQQMLFAGGATRSRVGDFDGF